jgi:cytochrome c oxidase subunit II
VRAVLAAACITLLMAGCGTSQQFAAIPADLDQSAVPRKTIEMTAEHYHFTPEEIHIPQGTLVTLKITSIDGTHGFSLGTYGIDETIPEKETKTIEFYAAKRGEYGFHCSHFCGIGHLGMTGRIIVD